MECATPEYYGIITLLDDITHLPLWIKLLIGLIVFLLVFLLFHKIYLFITTDRIKDKG